jgi:Na+/H+ antiporter NhaD/arsenite permease-like protein
MAVEDMKMDSKRVKIISWIMIASFAGGVFLQNVWLMSLAAILSIVVLILAVYEAMCYLSINRERAYKAGQKCQAKSEQKAIKAAREYYKSGIFLEEVRDAFVIGWKESKNAK